MALSWHLSSNYNYWGRQPTLTIYQPIMARHSSGLLVYITNKHRLALENLRKWGKWDHVASKNFDRKLRISEIIDNYCSRQVANVGTDCRIKCKGKIISTQLKNLDYYRSRNVVVWSWLLRYNSILVSVFTCSMLRVRIITMKYCFRQSLCLY